MHEDVNRNIWFGTDEGLIKWNGTRFKYYQNLNFSTNYSSIQEDSTGRIWCLNFTGQLFYVDSDSLKLFTDEQKLVHSSFNYNVTHFPKIYLTSNYGLIIYDFTSKSKEIYNENAYLEKKNFAIVNNEDTIFYDLINQLYPYKKGVMYWSRGILKYKKVDGDSKIIVNNPIKRSSATPSIYNYNDKTLLISNQGVKEKTPLISEIASDNKVIKINLNFNNEINPSSIYYDKEKQLFFIGSKDGLLILNKKYQSNYKSKILGGKNVSGFIKDKEGNYWISTLNDGVYILPALNILEFNTNLTHNKQFSYVLKGKSNEIYLIETYGGIYQLTKANHIKYIGNFKQRVENVIYNPYRNEIYAGNLRIGFNLDSKIINSSVYGRNFKSISFLDSSTIMVSSSTNANLRTSNEKNINYVSLFQLPNYQFNAKENFTYSKIRNKRSSKNTFDFINQIAYISYSDGLYYYQKGKEKEIRFDNSPILLTALSKAIKESIWTTTIDGHLLELNNGNIVNQEYLGLKTKEILKWKNYLFFNTNSGILKWNINTKQKNWINRLDGLPSNNINDIEIISDTIFAVTSKGIAKFSCNYHYTNDTPPLINIIKIAIWEKDTALFSSYNLKHNQDNVTFYFGANSTRSQKNYTYQYRMLGIDSLWIPQTSNINFARFPSIPSGDYTFQVVAINEDGVKSNIAEIKLIIDSPFYEKWWFYLLIGAFGVLIASSIFMIRIKVIRKQNSIINDKKEVEKQLSQSQLTALRSQMNPHFIFNALNSIQDYIISNNKEMASDYLGLFADLMRKYLHFSNEEEITLEEEVETLNMYLQLEKVRFEETFIYSINIGSNIDVSNINIPVMLIQPFAENAIKHGLLHKKGKRILEIDFKKDNQNLIIKIKDNGIGRKQSAEINKMRNKKHKSFATSAQQKRIELINQENNNSINIKYIDLYNKENEATGTLVNINIPL